MVHYSFILDGRKFNSDAYWVLLLGQYPGNVASSRLGTPIILFIHGSSLVGKPAGRDENTAWNHRQLKPFV